MSYQQCTIGEICSELLEEAIRIGYNRYGNMTVCVED